MTCLCLTKDAIRGGGIFGGRAMGVHIYSHKMVTKRNSAGLNNFDNTPQFTDNEQVVAWGRGG